MQYKQPTICLVGLLIPLVTSLGLSACVPHSNPESQGIQPVAEGGPKMPLPIEKTKTASQQREIGAYLIKLSLAHEKNMDLAQLRAALQPLFAAYGLRSIEPLSGQGGYLIRLEHDPGVAKIREIAQGNPMIESIQPNWRYRARAPIK